MRAQIFTLDAVVAIGLFIIILVSTVFIWDYSREKVFLNEKRNYLEMVSREALATLLETSGSPSSWHENQAGFNETSVKSLGLIENKPWLISSDKLQNFTSWNASKYGVYKNLLGLQGFDFHIEFWKYYSGFNSTPDYEVGLSPAGSAGNVVSLTRFALLEDTGSNRWLKIEMVVWEA